MEFSPQIAKSLRVAAGLSRSEAARRIGISRQGLINIEEGDSSPNASTLGDIASALGVSPEIFYVVHDDDDSATAREGCGHDQAPHAVSAKS